MVKFFKTMATFPVEEIVEVLTELASIEQVKIKLIQNKSVLDVIYKLLQTPKRPGERAKVLKFIWVLSFNGLAKKEMNDKKWEQFLTSLLSDEGVTTDETKSAQGILWNLLGGDVDKLLRTKNELNLGKKSKGKEETG